MQSTIGGGGGGGGLARYRSAPATWLEAILEGEDEDPLKNNNHSFTQLLSSSSTTKGEQVAASGSGPSAGLFDFQRQSSSPAGFIASSCSSDDYFSSTSGFGGIELNDGFEFGGSGVSGKRSRDDSFARPPSHLKVEDSGLMSGAAAAATSLVDNEMDKLFEESVPCRLRAKRGFATHPRSIAERVRRTKISDRIRKLQELVPNMDKQTNTADMLDEAVEYVKFLQRQIQVQYSQSSRRTASACLVNNPSRTFIQDFAQFADYGSPCWLTRSTKTTPVDECSVGKCCR